MGKLCCIIFARKGSKGLKNKNILDFCGKPLISHTIEFFQREFPDEDLHISTDSNQIIELARPYNINIIDRPSKLADDKAKEWDAWKHAIKLLSPDINSKIFLSLPPTSPLRKGVDVKKVIDKVLSGADISFCITESNANPHFNMVKLKNEDKFELFLNDGQVYHRRQDVPLAYNITTIAYAARPKFILESKHIFDGDVRCVQVDKQSSIDIDDKDDFALAEYFYNKK